MPLYHFHVVDGGAHNDPTGTECANEEEARHQALKAASDMLKDAAADYGPFGRSWTMTVTDPQGLVMFVIDFNFSRSPAAAR